MDSASGVVCVRDTTPSLSAFAKGFYLEGNIIVDAEQLVRNYDAKQTTVTFNNNILPMTWSGPGGGNAVLDPMLKHIPDVSETNFVNGTRLRSCATGSAFSPDRRLAAPARTAWTKAA